MKRKLELDGMRGIAIILVLIWHYLACAARFSPDSIFARFAWLLNFTWSGVDLFFVLSGFLIVGILLEAKGSTHYFRVFYLRRACRIFPLYYLMVFTFLVLTKLNTFESEWLFAKPMPLLSYLTFTQNFFMHRQGFGAHWLGITWSLAIEEQFYLLIPVLVRYLSTRVLLRLFLATIFMAPVLRIVIDGLGAYVFAFSRCDSILAGGTLAILLRDEATLPLLKKHRDAVQKLFFLLLAGAIVLTGWNNDLGGAPHHFLFSLLYVCFLLIPFVKPDGLISAFLGNKVLIWFGMRSYGIFLFHQPVNGLVHHLFFQSGPTLTGLSSVLATFLSLAVLFLISEISFRYYESFFIGIGRRSGYGTRSQYLNSPASIP